VDRRTGHDRSPGRGEGRLDPLGEVRVGDPAVVVKSDDRLPGIRLLPRQPEAEVPAGAVAAGEVLVAPAEHPLAIAPVVDAEGRVVELDGALAVVDDDEAGAALDQRLEVRDLDVAVGRDDDDHPAPTPIRWCPAACW
jgi:hypothetical protein